MRVLIILVVLGSLGFLVFQQITAKTSEPDSAKGGGKPTTVTVYTTRMDIFQEQIEALGNTFANESVEITTNTADIIDKILFKDSQQVSKGDVLVILEQDQEKAELASAKVALEQEQREYKRIEDLVKRKLTAENQLDERESQLNIARYRVQELEASIRDLTIRAPFSGVVGLRNISPGALIEPGDVITTLNDIDIIKLDFSVPVIYLPTLKAGLNIVATSNAFPDKLFRGKVTNIDTRIDPVTRSITARAELPNPNRTLKPGLLLNVQLIKDERQTIMIPEEALISRGDQKFVFVVDTNNDNKVVRKSVTTGGRRPGEVEVLTGLNLGEKIITRGITRVRPGQSVIIKSEDNNTL